MLPFADIGGGLGERAQEGLLLGRASASRGEGDARYESVCRARDHILSRIYNLVCILICMYVGDHIPICTHVCTYLLCFLGHRHHNACGPVFNAV